MNKKIKRYDLNNITVEDLIKNGFKYSEKGVISSIKTPRYYYFKYLCDDIELFIEIGINEDGSLYFDDYETILVIDDNFGQPYGMFYGDNENPFLLNVIKRYNEEMDKLVEKGLIKEKQHVNIENQNKNTNSRKRKKA